MVEPDEHVPATAAELSPVPGGGADLEGIQYGVYVDCPSRSAVSVAVAAGMVALGGWAWTQYGRAGFAATVAIVIPLAIALGVLLVSVDRGRRRCGIQLSESEVALGRWPDRTYRVARSTITKVTLSEKAWTGGSTAAVPSHDFRIPGRSYLVIATGSGDVFYVAVDPHNNPVTDHILAMLQRDAGRHRRRRSTAPATKTSAPSKTAAPPTRPPAARPAGNLGAPSSTERLWDAATIKHDEILLAYLPYEVDPLVFMRYPAMSDITRPATAAFQDALEEATALRTESMPSDTAFAASYRDAVRRLAVAWAEAERAAKRDGIGYLDDADRRKLSQATKLLRHAEGAATTHERAAYLRQVKTIMDELVEHGALYAPPKVLDAIETQTALAIEALTSE